MFRYILLSIILCATTAFADEIQGYNLAPPPAIGSQADHYDSTVLHYYQFHRTLDECARAEQESNLSLENMFGPETGVLTKEEVKQASEAANSAIRKAVWISFLFKQHFNRPRPYRKDPTIVPCISKPLDLLSIRSYPSSYAVVATVLEALLIREFPEKQNLISRQAKQIGLNRVLGGVHHPSDITAGVELGHQMAKRLFQ